MITLVYPLCKRSSKQKAAMEEPVEQLQQLRIRISSKSFRSLEKVCADIVRFAKGMRLRVWGPVWVPTKVVNIRTRLGPSPEGTNLYGNYVLRVYQRSIDIFSPSEVVKQIVSGSNECVFNI